MINKFFACIMMSVLVFVSCAKNDNSTENTPVIPFEGNSDRLPADCNVELVSATRITADLVTDRLSLGDYVFVLKSVETEKEKISVEGRYAKNGTAAAIVTVSTLSVGIDETIEITISSDDIETDEDFDCMEYVIKVEAKDTRNCEYTGTDC